MATTRHGMGYGVMAPFLDYRKLDFMGTPGDGGERPPFVADYVLDPKKPVGSPVFRLTVTPQQDDTVEELEKLLAGLKLMQVAFGLVTPPGHEDDVAAPGPQDRGGPDPAAVSAVQPPVDPGPDDGPSYSFEVEVVSSGAYDGTPLVAAVAAMLATVEFHHTHKWTSKTGDLQSFWVHVSNGAVRVQPHGVRVGAGTSSPPADTVDGTVRGVAKNKQPSDYDVCAAFRRA